MMKNTQDIHIITIYSWSLWYKEQEYVVYSYISYVFLIPHPKHSSQKWKNKFLGWGRIWKSMSEKFRLDSHPKWILSVLVALTWTATILEHNPTIFSFHISAKEKSKKYFFHFPGNRSTLRKIIGIPWFSLKVGQLTEEGLFRKFQPKRIRIGWVTFKKY
jgi:hypothetical protein